MRFCLLLKKVKRKKGAMQAESFLQEIDKFNNQSAFLVVAHLDKILQEVQVAGVLVRYIY